jgi:hypothetical protein
MLINKSERDSKTSSMKEITVLFKAAGHDLCDYYHAANVSSRFCICGFRKDYVIDRILYKSDSNPNIRRDLA